MSFNLGQIGLEIQIRHIAFDYGVGLMDLSEGDDNFHALGIRYFINAYESSWYFALSRVKVNHTNSKTYIYGLMPGYRWMWGKHWNLGTGVGAGYALEDRSKNSALPDEEYVHVVLEISLRYSF